MNYALIIYIGSSMQFIEALKLRSKLFFLFVLITVGLIAVGIMGALNVNNMKKNLDSLYFGSLVPVTELNSILHSYHGRLASTIYKTRGKELDLLQTSDVLKSTIKQINILWSDYESHFKRDSELEYIEYVALEIKEINQYFLRLLDNSNEIMPMKTVSILVLEKKISHIDNVLKKLINYEVDMARYERKVFLKKYDAAVFRLGFTLGLIIITVLIILYSVFTSIQSDHTRLELTTRKLKNLNKKLETVSYTDTLTSMHNRRYFNLVYEKELKRARRTHSYITFMMLDIDYFKQYNDTYGHIEGDFALKSVAKVLKRTLQRPSDFVFRLGGEEFGVLLTQTDESNSAKLARAIGDNIRAEEIEHSGSKVHKYLTISLGVVCCIADDALNEDVLITRADEMLYEAKETGRDRYVITSNVSESKTKSIEGLTA